MAAAPTFTFGPLFWLSMIGNCGGILLLIATCVLGIVILVSTRRTLAARLAYA